MSAQLDELTREERRNKRILTVGVVAMAFALVVVLVRLSQFAENQDRVLRLAQQNHDELAEKNTLLQQQVDGSRDVLTQLYAALNASQKQVTELGGTPLHFEFTVPTTTTTAGPPPTNADGSPAPTTTTSSTPSLSSQNASGTVNNPLVVAVETLFLLPIVVPLPPEVIAPPEITIPPVDTLPPLPDLTLPSPIGVPTT